MPQHQRRDRRTEQQWRDRIQQWQRSGLTVRAFCARYRLAEPSFYAWRRTVQQRPANATPFVPVRVLGNAAALSADPLEVILASGHRLRVPPGFDPATLRHVLALLEEAPSC